MRFRRVAYEILGEMRHLRHGLRAEPARVGVVEHADRIGGLQEQAPFVEHVLELPVDPVVQERGEPRVGAHRPVEDRVDRAADKPGVVVFRGVRQDVVEELEHVVNGPDLGLVCRRRLAGGLRQHEREQHVDLGVPLDQLPELLDHREQRHVAAGVGLRDEAIKPPPENLLVRWKPLTYPEQSSARHHISPWPAARARGAQ
ncbi:MAG TPA: hypothetical protein VKG61_16540, partial [Streptosporangiaceae bacterium]|nr:hypothetical protein [Streptosporangiaceae bacterium]